MKKKNFPRVRLIGNAKVICLKISLSYCFLHVSGQTKKAALFSKIITKIQLACSPSQKRAKCWVSRCQVTYEFLVRIKNTKFYGVCSRNMFYWIKIFRSLGFFVTMYISSSLLTSSLTTENERTGAIFNSPRSLARKQCWFVFKMISQHKAMKHINQVQIFLSFFPTKVYCTGGQFPD